MLLIPLLPSRRLIAAIAVATTRSSPSSARRLGSDSSPSQSVLPWILKIMGTHVTEYDDGTVKSLMDDEGVFYGGDGVDPGKYTVAEYILDNLRKHAVDDKIAQVDAETDEAWSYRTLLSEAVHVAAALTEEGWGPGDTMAFFSRNCHELFSSVMGCVLAGVTVATMVPIYGPEELRFQLKLCKPKVIFVEPELIDRAVEALKCFPYAVRVISLRGPESRDGLPTYASLVERATTADPDNYTPVPIDDKSNHVVFVCYSSGTTGLPKGVQMTNAGVTSMVLNLCAVPDLPGAPVLTLAPISWASGAVVLLKSTEFGHKRVFMAEPNELAVVSSFQKYKIQLWPTAPCVLLTLCSHPAVSLFDFSNLRAVMSGGSPLSGDLQSLAAERMSCLVVQAYGSTETGIVLASSAQRNKPGSLGAVERTCRVRLVDLDTNEVIKRPGHVGELRVKTPNVMLGYIGNPEATAECYDEHGWFRSGDLVYFDSDGFFFYVDRLKEMIKYRSHQVAPSEVEAVLSTHPALKDACVLGLPHPVDGELPAAFVVKEKKSVTEQEIQDFIAGRLSDPKKLRGGVIFIDTIPRTTTGKPMRAQLKKMLMSHL